MLKWLVIPFSNPNSAPRIPADFAANDSQKSGWEIPKLLLLLLHQGPDGPEGNWPMLVVVLLLGTISSSCSLKKMVSIAIGW